MIFYVQHSSMWHDYLLDNPFLFRRAAVGVWVKRLEVVYYKLLVMEKSNAAHKRRLCFISKVLFKSCRVLLKSTCDINEVCSTEAGKEEEHSNIFMACFIPRQHHPLWLRIIHSHVLHRELEWLRFREGSSWNGVPQTLSSMTQESVQHEVAFKTKTNVNIQENLWQNVKVLGGSV